MKTSLKSLSVLRMQKVQICKHAREQQNALRWPACGDCNLSKAVSLGDANCPRIDIKSMFNQSNAGVVISIDHWTVMSHVIWSRVQCSANTRRTGIGRPTVT